MIFKKLTITKHLDSNKVRSFKYQEADTDLISQVNNLVKA